ncbi:MAG: lectin MOA-related protein [Nitrososphaerales archaeon]
MSIILYPFNFLTVKASVVEGLLRKAFPSASIFLRDSYYRLLPKEAIEQFLAKDLTDREQYLSEFFDCDDFSFVLMGRVNLWFPNAFGILWAYPSKHFGHALNCFVDFSFKVWCVEPQNDNVFEPPKNWDYYLVVM